MWEERWSNSRQRKYYFNAATGESVWDRPSDLATVHCHHILLKHSASRRPSSHRAAVITRSEAEAVRALQEIGARCGSFEEFKREAGEWSDCSSAGRGGDLGEFGRGQMQRPFEEAAFALQPGQMSGIVKTESGVHLIWRVK